MDRQRKTLNPCERCRLHVERCLCSEIPSLNLSTRIALVVHDKELKRTTNTGRLALAALSNSCLRVRGREQTRLDLGDLLSEEYETLLLYPSDEARELTSDYVKTIRRPVQLIVPDGNWRQASKVHYRHTEIAHVPRVTLKNKFPNPLVMRKETVPEGMATLEAIAQALGVLEGPVVEASLRRLYQTKLERTLQGRGLL